jgi:hypothetical protein
MVEPKADKCACSIQQPRLCFTNNDVQIVQLCAPQTTDAKNQLSNPVLTKVSAIDDPFTTPIPSTIESPKPIAAPGALVPNNNDSSLTAIASSPMVQKFLQRSLHLAVDDLFKSGTVEQLMASSLNQVTSFDTEYKGTYSSDSYDINKVFDSEENPSPAPSAGTDNTARKGPRLSRSKVCHQKSSMGVVLGSIWIRTSTLKVAKESSITLGHLEVITSFIFYPASWLTRVGLRYGTEASLQWSPSAGWNFNIAAIRAVPENSLIFDMCRDGNVKAVQRMLTRGDASVKDTSPKGWTPLHVSLSPKDLI